MAILSRATRYSFLALQVLFMSLLIDGQEMYEPVCPLDFSLVQTNESSDETTQRRRLQQQQEHQRMRSLEDTSPVEIIQQSGDSVQFIVKNTSPDADHFFVSYYTDVFYSQHCAMFQAQETTEVITATCHDTHTESGTTSLVRVYVRTPVEDSNSGGADVPACCHDPYEGNSEAPQFTTTEYTYELSCSPSCDAPDNYYQDDDINEESPTEAPTEDVLQSPPAGATPTTQSPTVSPTQSPTVSSTPVPTTKASETPTDYPTGTPITNSPTVSSTPVPTTKASDTPTDYPTGAPITKSPTVFPTASPTISPQETCSKEATSHHSRDHVMGSQKNGPHWGSRHPWAWPSSKNSNNAACGWYDDVDNEGAGAYAWPCGVDDQMVNNRILNFDSKYMNFQFDFDDGMTASISLADSAAGAGDEIAFFASGSSGNSCSSPKEGNWDDYPIRLVKSGRYYHHWYAEKVGCNGGSDDTRLEIKVTPDW